VSHDPTDDHGLAVFDGTRLYEHADPRQGNLGGVEAAPIGWHGRPHSPTVTLPPLAAIFFKGEG
jgi:1,4-alpha-glucan branching enzyme